MPPLCAAGNVSWKGGCYPCVTKELLLITSKRCNVGTNRRNQLKLHSEPSVPAAWKHEHRLPKGSGSPDVCRNLKLFEESGLMGVKPIASRDGRRPPVNRSSVRERWLASAAAAKSRHVEVLSCTSSY